MKRAIFIAFLIMFLSISGNPKRKFQIFKEIVFVNHTQFACWIRVVDNVEEEYGFLLEPKAEFKINVAFPIKKYIKIMPVVCWLENIPLKKRPKFSSLTFVYGYTFNCRVSRCMIAKIYEIFEEDLEGFKIRTKSTSEHELSLKMNLNKVNNIDFSAIDTDGESSDSDNDSESSSSSCSNK